MKILKTIFALALMLLSTNAALAMTPYQLAVAMFSTSNVACLDLTTNLSRGSADDRGKVDSVLKLQAFLYPQYLTEPPTGYFGVLTEAAVVKFQKENNITPAEGFVGALTRAKIKELSCGGSLQTLSINTINPAVAKVGETVVLGGTGLNTGGDYILFDGYRIETDGSKALNRLAFAVPEYLSHTINCIKAPCPSAPVRSVIPGDYVVQVVNNLGTSNKMILTVTDGVVVPPKDAPKISSVVPSGAKVDEKVIIYGYNLTRPEAQITFDGVKISGDPVYFKRLGNFDSALEFTVPEYLSQPCIRLKPTDRCPLGMVRKVTPGTYELAVENKYGSDAVKFEVLGNDISKKPQLQALRPMKGVVGTEVDLYGKNLQTGSEKVYFGGSLVETKLLSTNSRGVIRFKVPEYITPCGYEDNTACRMMAQLVTPGKYDVVVKNSVGVSNALTFEVTGTNNTSAPKINSLNPSDGVVGTEVVIKGEGINIGDDRIYFNGSLIKQSVLASADVVNALRFKVPSSITPCGVGSDGLCKIASQPVTPGIYNVVVVNKNGTSNSRNFTVTGAVSTGLEITNFYAKDYTFANGSSVGAGRKLVWTSTGAEYCEAAGAWSGTRPVNGEHIIGFMSQPLTYTLKCYNNKGLSVSKSVTDPSTGTSQNPTISRIDPVQGTTNSTVTIAGTNFLSNGTTVEFYTTGGVLKGNIFPSVINSTNIRFTLNGLFANNTPILPGTYKVGVVTNNCVGGCSSNRVDFTVTSNPIQQAPVISSISHTVALVGTKVAITGERINTASPMIIFGNGVITPDLIRANDSYLTFIVPASMPRYCSNSIEMACTDDMISVTPGTYNVKVVNSLGTSNGKSVTVVAPEPATPSISSITYPSGGTGVPVTLNGSNFNPASDSVWFGGVELTPNRSAGSASALIFTVPQTLFQCEAVKGQECLTVYQPTPLGTYQVKVENSAGKVSNIVNYQVTSNGSISDR